MDIQKLFLVLVLSLLIGLEREEHRPDKQFSFGGIRTFPLIGIIGYVVALLTNNNPLTLSVGLVVIAGFMLLSFQHKLSDLKKISITSEISALLVYLIGALIYAEHYWIATAVVVISTLLLELKESLEGLAVKLPAEEILTFTKFLLLSAVILPVLPNEKFTDFHINPFTTWLIIVSMSGLSYGSYILQKMIGNRSGVFLSALFGGAYSSTVTTIVLAKRSKDQPRTHLFSGSILAASGVMYLRLGILLCIFNEGLRKQVAPFLFGLALIAIFSGFFWSRRSEATAEVSVKEIQPKNPLELSSAFFFAFVFLAMMILTGLVLAHFGNLGVYLLALITGVTDVDPFIMGLTQSAGASTPLQIAAAGILIAAASNNLAKGAYAYFLSKGKEGNEALILLVLLALAGLIPLIFVYL